MGYQWLRRMPYLSKTRHGVFKYRRTIPPALREAAGGCREFNKSFETRDPQEAKKLWAAVNLEFERYLSDLEAISKAPEGKAPIDVQQRIGSDFLKRHGMTYISLTELRAKHEEHGNRHDPSELEQRLALVGEELGIAVDDEEE